MNECHKCFLNLVLMHAVIQFMRSKNKIVYINHHGFKNCLVWSKMKPDVLMIMRMPLTLYTFMTGLGGG